MSLKAVWFGFGLLLLGCEGPGSSDEGSSCVANSDCRTGSVCQVLERPESGLTVAAPCPSPFCTTDTQCGAGSICGPSLTPVPSCFFQNVCRPSCQTAGCLPDEICGATGRCELAPCQETGSLACPMHWRCDLAASRTEPPNSVGSNASSGVFEGRVISRGCVRVRCDQPDGHTCNDLWRCAPAESTDGSGCVPRACTETGHCSEDLTYLCVPTSAGPHVSTKDAHGCTQRNCEEGTACGTFQVCDVRSAAANEFGCRLKHCTDPAFDCGDRAVCDPSSALANGFGCVSTLSGSAGAAGVGGTGTGGTGGTGSAGRGNAGAANDPGLGGGAQAPQGRCVETNL